MSEVAATIRPPSTVLSLWRDYLELSKARIVFMVLLTALAGFLIAANGIWSWTVLVNLMIGTGLIAAGTNALNQYVERDLDGRMRRTSSRPIPAGRIGEKAALVFSVSISIAGALYLALAVGLLVAALGVFTLLSYLFVYTPMKRISSSSLLIGAVPGAVPPMMGWAAVTGHLELGAWILFGILFLWQLPHFLAIGWMYRDDYASAGFSVLAVNDSAGIASGRQAMFYSAILLPVSLLPTLVGIAGMTYLAGALLCGMIFIASSVSFARAHTMKTARVLFAVSIFYLPLVMTLLVLNS